MALSAVLAERSYLVSAVRACRLAQFGRVLVSEEPGGDQTALPLYIRVQKAFIESCNMVTDEKLHPICQEQQC